MRRSTLGVLFVFALTLATGCFSVTTHHSATPVEKGTGQVNASIGYNGIAVDSENTSGNASINLPTSEIQMRYGAADKLGMGLKVFPVGLGIDVNYAPVNTDNFALSFDPAFTFATVGAASWGFVQLNILADVVKTEKSKLTLGAKPGLLYAFGSDSNADTTAAYGSTEFGIGPVVGFQYMFSEEVGVQPAFDAMYLPEPSAFFYQGTIGVVVNF